MSETRSEIGVVGGGPWGVALARAAVRAGSKVTLHTRRESPDSRLIRTTTDYGEVAKHRLLILAVPTEAAAEVARALGDHLDGSHIVIHGVRGLAYDDLSTISEIVRRETPARRLGALGGPVQADELQRGTASALMVGSPFPEVQRLVAKTLEGPWLRVYPTADLRGLEWSSALVGCLAVGLGFAQAGGAGPGLLAALISRGMYDASRIAVLAGAEEQTIYGLGGYGDLLASIALENRPEVVVGRALARGMSLEQARKEAKLRVEAVELIPRLLAFARANQLSVPAFEGLTRMLGGERGEEILGKFFAA